MVHVEKSNTTIIRKEKIKDTGIKLDFLLSVDIDFYELLLEILEKVKEEN